VTGSRSGNRSRSAGVVPDAGSVEVFDTDVAGGRRAAYADVDAMLEGARNDYWRLTVRENLRYFATIHGVDPDSVARRHDRLLERFDLAAKADTPVRELSRGMKQKVSLASVLAGGAELVFLDEPTLRERFGVGTVESADGRTSVEVAAAGDALYDLTDVLRAAGVTIEDIRTVQPELEEVFVDRTGMETGGDHTEGRSR